MIAGYKDGSRVKVLTAAVLAALVAIAMTTLAVGNAYAKEFGTVKDGDYTFKVYFDGTENEAHSVFISEYSGSDTQLILPTKLAKDAQYTENGTSSSQAIGDVVIGEVMIGESVFKGNSTLEKVAMPAGVEGIGTDAFAECSSLTEIAIGGPTSEWPFNFGSNAFVDCPNLKTYYIADGAYNGIGSSGIGQKSDGSIYEGVVVYTDASEGSDIFAGIAKINAAAREKFGDDANQITIKYVADPYSKHTVKPTQSSGDSGDSGAGDNGGTGDNGSGDNDDKPLTIDPTKQMGKDGTAYGEGAAAEAAEKAITDYKKEADPKGTVFNLLQAKVKKVTNKSVALSWKKVSGAAKYVVYGNICNKNLKQVKLTSSKKTTATFKKIAKKAVKKNTYYKFTVVALNKKNQVISTSKIIHAATPGGKFTNAKAVNTAAKAKKNAITLKKGKTFNLKAKIVPLKKGVKQQRHRPIAYEADKSIVTVSKTGAIKAKKKGTCYVYAYAQNGVCAKIKVTVK